MAAAKEAHYEGEIALRQAGGQMSAPHISVRAMACFECVCKELAGALLVAVHKDRTTSL